MKVLDLRSRAARDWQRRGEKGRRSTDGTGQAWWVRGAASVVAAVQAGRIARRPALADGRWIVSVGNLALGGTGKTPVVARLAGDLARAGVRGCVLTRGYGSAARGPLVVDPADPAAGDEARMMAAELAGSGWSVVQARNRRSGLDWLAEHLPEADMVLLEDAHQTRVGRHLDILIVDSWELQEDKLAPVTGGVFPLGPWRESARGADRADLILVEADDPPARARGGQPVAGFSRSLVVDEAPAPETPWVALSGVARPERFETDAAGALDRDPLLVIRCDDHAPYDLPLLEKVTGALRDAGCPVTVTTAKDWIKLEAVWPEDLPLRVARQELVWTGKQALPKLVGERLEDWRRRT